VNRAVLPPVRILESGDPKRLEALREEWTELFDASGCANPFLSWEWLHTWWQLFGARRAIWVMEARDRGGRLTGLLSLIGRTGMGGGRRWSLLGNGLTGADHLDILARPGFAEHVREGFARALASSSSRWDALDLEDMPVGSPTVQAFRSVLRAADASVEVAPRFVCPAIAIGGSFSNHVAQIRGRETYGRRVRWLERQPGFRIDVARAPADAGEAVEDFLRLHRLRWSREGGSYGIPPGGGEEFHRQVVPLLAERGWLRMYRMTVEGKSIAAVYGIEVGRTFFYYQSGMDPDWSNRSPGLVLIGRTIEDAWANGLTDYDFLRGTESHKMAWATDRREVCALRAWAPGLRAEATHAAEEVFRAARSAARAVAPESMWSALQRARRNWTANAGRAEAAAPKDAPPPVAGS
jgi:CelD/BcsL family acetyltransferase involved in cellulose biosynthesis